MCFACSANISRSNNVPAGVTAIPVVGILNDNIGSLLALAWCQNSDKVKAAFKAKTGLTISQSELAVLAKAHSSGNDLKLYGVNFLDVLSGIKFTQSERDKATCTI